MGFYSRVVKRSSYRLNSLILAAVLVGFVGTLLHVIKLDDDMAEPLTTTICNVSINDIIDCDNVITIVLYFFHRQELGVPIWHLQLHLVHCLLKFGDCIKCSLIRNWFTE